MSRGAISVSEPAELVAGRYELVRRIARGGMGEVFAAHDRSSGRPVALKRLLASDSEQRSERAHFMREYHALSSLSHPCIIQVYDYGLDHGTPYYTMELLDGKDLRELLPVGYRDACAYLRDVASSLALLHARRLLHRDVSPRNVRRTSDGRCKLIDFGAMIPFGVPPNLVGTAPCIPPEALQGGSLDQRADLYSLGAVAYCLLTGRHAYDVTKVDELAEAWDLPVERPRRLVAGLPNALDELVMSLLSFNPMKRPKSAAEVMDWLSAIGQLPPQENVEQARSFLVSSQLCGRQAHTAELERHVQSAIRGEGCAISIEGRPGSGKSRMLSEAALIAQTAGFAVTRAVARLQHGSTQTLARDLLAALRQVAPLEAERGGASRIVWPVTGAESATVHEGLDADARAKLQQQLSAVFCGVARLRPLLVVVDDCDCADEFSLAVLAGLAHQADELPLLIVTAGSEAHDAEVDASSPLSRVASERLWLKDLSSNQTADLLHSMFGSAPNLDRLVAFMYRAVHGNPKLTVALAEQLLREGLVRYVAGNWLLPSDDIPQQLGIAASAPVPRLSEPARALAEILSVRRGGANTELCLAVTGLPTEDVFVALDELVREGVLESAGQEYVFAHQAARDALRAGLSAERSAALHRRWADALLARAALDVDTELEVGWHLVHTDDELAGAQLLARVAPLLVDRGLAMATAIPALEKALAIFEKHGAPLQARLRVRSTLVLAGYLFDYRLALRYGEETLAILHQLSGVALAARLSRWLGGTLALGVSMAWYELRRVWTRASLRGPPVYTALQYFVRSAMGLLGVRSVALDTVGAIAIVDMLAPLASAPGFTSGRVVQLAAHAIVLKVVGRESAAAAALADALAAMRVGRRWDMSEFEYQNLQIGLLTADGVNEAYREGSTALQRAEQLERMGIPLAQAAAEQVRMFHWLVRGDSERAERSRRRLDLNAIQGGTTWQVEWFAVPAEGMAGALWTDLVALRRSVEKLDRLVVEVPGLLPHRDIISIAYHVRRGEYALAVELGEQFVAKYPERTFIAWAVTYGMIALAFVELGQAQRARELCERALAQIPEPDLAYFAMYATLEVAYATSLAVLGERERSQQILETRFARLRACGEHASLVALYEQQARIAWLTADAPLLEQALRAMRYAAVDSGFAPLILLAERSSELRARLKSSPRPPAPDGTTSTVATNATTNDPSKSASDGAATVFLRRYKTGRERNLQALRMLASWFASDEAHLYACRRQGPLKLMASSTRRAPPAELLGEIESALITKPGPSLIAELQALDPRTGASMPVRYRVLLIPGAHDAERIVGAVALRDSVDATETLPAGLIADIGTLLTQAEEIEP